MRTMVRLRRSLANRHLWLICLVMVGVTFIYYADEIPLIAMTLEKMPFQLTRHALQRTLFVLPVAYATLAFGMAGGLTTLFVAFLIMMPRMLFISLYPLDAFMEVLVVCFVGGVMSWVIESLEKERRLRQKAISRLTATNAISEILNRSLELEQILDVALEKVLEVTGLDAGLIFILDEGKQELNLAAYRGISLQTAKGVDRLKVGEGFCGQVAQTGEPLVVDDTSKDERLTRVVIREEGFQAQLIVPLKSKRKAKGVMALARRGPREFVPEEIALISTIGNQIGVAIENAQLYQNMRFYVRQITHAQEAERERMARELHDDTAQALLVLRRHLGALMGSPQQLSESVLQRLEQTRQLTDEILEGVRRFSQDLRPPTLDDLGLLPTLEGLVADLRTQEGIDVQLKVLGSQRRLSPEAELVLFRMVQEALNNVRRHAQASKVVTTVEFADGRVRLTVSDNGRGFELPGRMSDLAAAGKLGLMGMHERARLLGGVLTIESEVGKGTTVIADVPA